MELNLEPVKVDIQIENPSLERGAFYSLCFITENDLAPRTLEVRILSDLLSNGYTRLDLAYNFCVGVLSQQSNLSSVFIRAKRTGESYEDAYKADDNNSYYYVVLQTKDVVEIKAFNEYLLSGGEIKLQFYSSNNSPDIESPKSEILVNYYQGYVTPELVVSPQSNDYYLGGAYGGGAYVGETYKVEYQEYFDATRHLVEFDFATSGGDWAIKDGETGETLADSTGYLVNNTDVVATYGGGYGDYQEGIIIRRTTLDKKTYEFFGDSEVVLFYSRSQEFYNLGYNETPEKMVKVLHYSKNVNSYRFYTGLSDLIVPPIIPSNVTSTSEMFYNCPLFNQDLSNWDTSNVTNMSAMFESCESFTQDLSTWNTSNVTDMSRMFAWTYVFNGDVSTWDTSNVTDMSYTFAGCEFFNQDLSNWNTSSVTNMEGMLSSITDFNQPIGNWNTSNVTNMESMFEWSSNFNQNIDGWDVSKVTNMEKMFSRTDSFNQDLNSWDISSVTSLYDMFQKSKAFNGNISNWDTSSVTNMIAMFSEANQFNQDISLWDTSNVTNMELMFQQCYLFNQNIGGWNTSKVTSMNSMFVSASLFNQDISDWDTSKVTSMARMFRWAKAFNQDISGWDVSSIPDIYGMYYLFDGATAFNRDLSAWCVTNIKTKPEFFDNLASSWTLPRPVWGTCPRGEI